jgi:NAD(P)H-dependent FMN reductase
MTDSASLPNLSALHVDTPTIEKLSPAAMTHAPRILLLYGSLRERSFSRLLVLEAERLLRHFGAETRVFDPHGLQSSVAKAWQEFGDDDRMKPSAYYDRLVDVMEELVKFTLIVRERSDYLTSRYSERKAAHEDFPL